MAIYAVHIYSEHEQPVQIWLSGEDEYQNAELLFYITNPFTFWTDEWISERQSMDGREKSRIFA